MKLREAFPILPRQHTFIVGTNGAGKSTTVAKAILPYLPNRIIIDPKRDFDYPNCKLITDPSELSKVTPDEEKTILYRPEPEFWNVEYYNAVYKWIYMRQHTTCYTDELLQVMNGLTPPHYLRVCITAGRSLGITMISGTQRPRRIPVEIITESSHFFMHQLCNPDDVETMAGYMPGYTQVTKEVVDGSFGSIDTKLVGKRLQTVYIPLHSEHSFYYYNRKTPKVPTQEYLINLRKGTV